MSLQPIAAEKYDEEKDINDLIDEVSATTHMAEYDESSPALEDAESVDEAVNGIYYSNL